MKSLRVVDALVLMLVSVLKFLRALFDSLFGKLSWSPPGWIFEVARGLRSSAARADAMRRGNPRHFWRRVTGLLIFAGSVGLAYSWYKNRPLPAYVAYTLQAPPATPLKKDALPANFRIVFASSAARIDAVGKPLTSGVELSPALSGEWSWIGDKQLVFHPREDWAVDQAYAVSMKPEIFAPHVLLESYETGFKSASFEAHVANAIFYEDPTDPKVKRVVATLRFSHPIEKSGLERLIDLTFLEGGRLGFLNPGERKTGFNLQFDDFGGEAYIHSEQIAIPMADSSMRIRIEQGLRSSRGGNRTPAALESRVHVPGMFNYFRIDSVEQGFVRNREYETEQIAVVSSTAAVNQFELHKSLKLFLLPQHRPAFQGRPEQRDYEWYDASEIGTEVLAQSSELPITWLPPESDYTKVHSFKYRAPPGRYIYLRVKNGIKSQGDYVLAKDFDTAMYVEPFPKEVRIMHEGALLSLSGDKKLSVITRDVEAVKIEISRVLPGTINQLVSQTRGDFQKPSFVYNFSQDSISELFSEVRRMPQLEAGKAAYTALDFSPMLLSEPDGARGLFVVQLRSWDPVRGVATGAEDRRLVMLTDLGVLVKDSLLGEHDVFVQSFRTGQPEEGVSVDVIGANGLPVSSRVSGPDGHVTFPNLGDYKRDKQPLLYLVRKGPDLSFLPFAREDRRLNLSRFDVGGVSTRQDGQTLQAYLFSERGIYRPGDEIHIGLIVKPIDWSSDIGGVPLELTVTDPRGVEIQKRSLRFGAEGLEEHLFQTQESAPTGQYQFNLYVVKDGQRSTLLGSTLARVEEFLPDRMKISSGFTLGTPKGWAKPETVKAYVGLQNLFGTPAIGRTVKAAIGLFPGYASFREYPEFNFYDPMRAKRSFTETIEPGTTDEQGRVEFDLDLARFEKATYKLLFSAEGFEAEGGRAVASQSAILVSPLDFLVGYKADGDLSYVSRGTERSLNLIAVDPDLRQREVSGLHVEVAEIRYVSILTKLPNGTYAYQSVRREMIKKREDLTIPKAGGQYRLPTAQPGSYALIIRDDAGTELNRAEFTIAGESNVSGAMEANAELQLRLDRADYAPGQDIELQITSPYTGAGLITIEKDKLYAFQWFKSDSTTSVQRIRVPEELEGNGYVNVSFVRSLDSKEIFLSPLSYAVAPFSVSRTRRTNAPSLEAPELVRPGEELRIGYSTPSPAKMILFGVDEGILQVARYRAPDPLGHFLRKRSLEVSTAQILDLLIPEFELAQSLSAPGGDGEGDLGRNLNPFKRKRQKPVVFWSGILEAGPDRREFSYTVPDYFNGSIKLFAVAVSGNALGVTESRSTVRGHFVISPNVPTFAAPGDELAVSVSVANNLESPGEEDEISLDLGLPASLTPLDGLQRSLKVKKGHEGSAAFRLRAGSVLGSAGLEFRAGSGNKRAKLAVDLSVRPASQRMTLVSSGFLRKGSADLPVLRKMYPDLRELRATASTVPLGLARGISAYLKSFPYSCTEQLVSQAYVALLLRARPEFGYPPADSERDLAKILAVLQARQNDEGAFGFWAANSHFDPFQTVYALHFLTDTLQRGQTVPRGVLERGLGYLKELSKQTPGSLSNARIQAYAMYVLVRNGQMPGGELQGLRDLLDKTYKDSWRSDLAGVYLAAVYRILQRENDARQLIRYAEMESLVTPDYDSYYDDLVHDAQLLYVLAKHFPENLQYLKADSMLALAKPVAGGSFNTLSGAYAVAGFDAYASAAGNPAAADLAIAEVLADGKLEPLTLTSGLFPEATFSERASAIRFSGRSEQYLFYQTVEEGFDREPPRERMSEGLEIVRELRNQSGQAVDKAVLGEKLDVWINVRSTDGKTHSNIAVVDLLPAGFEVEISAEGSGSRRSLGGGERAWTPQYVDLREDRALMFGRVGPDVSTYVYRIRAVNLGQYSMPPAYAESMYDRALKARSLGGKVSVENGESE